MDRTQHNESIVVVGGGSIGLSAAYNLAKGICADSAKPRIIVIEAFDKPFAAASSSCTGCFHYAFSTSQTQPLLELGKYSFDLWAAEAKNDDFVRATGYRAQSSFGINPGSGHGLSSLPDWVQAETSWDVDRNVLGDWTATVNPTGVGNWLVSQCSNLGVEIETGLKLADVSLSADNKVQAVTCMKEDGSKTCLECKQLLIACGPWTPTIYEKVFPSSPIRLRWTTAAGDWIVCKNPCPTTDASTAFVSFASLVGEKLEFAARNDGSIWACGRRNNTATLPGPGHVDEPDDGFIQELAHHAQRFLNWRCACSEKHDNGFDLLEKGRSFRPATPSGLPTISEVPSSDLAIGRDGKNETSGVFVCWGHGSYGLTLGMGSGRLVAQMMLGEKPDLDPSPFSLDQGRERADVTPSSKGKEMARFCCVL